MSNIVNLENIYKIEIIPDRLYFSTIRKFTCSLKSGNEYHGFCTDELFTYTNFHKDFGPLSLASIYKYCKLIIRKLKMKSLSKRKLVHYTCMYSNIGAYKRVNAALLMGTYMICEIKMTAEKAFEILNSEPGLEYADFRDASFGPSTYLLTLLDCLKGFEKGLKNDFFNLTTFNLTEYEHYEKVDNGDFNWIIPEKIIAFCSPHYSGKIDRSGFVLHSPQFYLPYFTEHNVKLVIRLNNKTYDSKIFTNANIEHIDLYFPDGSIPTDAIVDRFIEVCDACKGVVAVHCKAGLGRTGTLIGCYMLKHYQMTAREVIAWIRLTRPGSIIGPQQNFIERTEMRFLNGNRLSLTSNELTSHEQTSVSFEFTPTISPSLSSPKKKKNSSHLNNLNVLNSKKIFNDKVQNIENMMSGIEIENINEKIIHKDVTCSIFNESVSIKERLTDIPKENAYSQGDKLNLIKYHKSLAGYSIKRRLRTLQKYPSGIKSKEDSGVASKTNLKRLHNMKPLKLKQVNTENVDPILETPPIIKPSILNNKNISHVPHKSLNKLSSDPEPKFLRITRSSMQL